IDRAVREVFARGFNDPRIAGLITITGVRVLEDLSRAVVGISVMPQDKEELTLHGLRSAAPYVRREVGELIQTRQMPQIEFEADRSIKKQASLLRDLDRVREDLAKRGGAAESAPTPSAEGGDP